MRFWPHPRVSIPCGQVFSCACLCHRCGVPRPELDIYLIPGAPSHGYPGSRMEDSELCGWWPRADGERGEVPLRAVYLNRCSSSERTLKKGIARINATSKLPSSIVCDDRFSV